jgi:hypothetical protein
MLALETRAWRGWCFVRLPTTDGVGGNKNSPIVFSWLSYTRRFDDRRGRHVKRARETSWRQSSQWQKESAHDTGPDLGGAAVVHTRIGRFVELFAQIQERLVVGGLWAQAFVERIRGKTGITTTRR